MRSRLLVRCSALIVLLIASVSFAVEDVPFLVGEFKVTRVVDGDTIAVDGLEETIRFLCIDTEECEKGPGAEQRTLAVAQDYLRYVREKTDREPMTKFNTPMGWEAKKFAEQWFPIGSAVRVEYDNLARKTGYYGRVLGYVFAKRNGEWINYNVECVRAGMSPYYEKYGHSERFEPQFLAAEREARIHQRGVWSPYAMAYPNYNERIAWWARRAATMKQFEAKYGGQKNAIRLIDEDDWGRLKELIGQEVILFGSLAKARPDASPPLLEFEHKQYLRLAVLVPEKGLFDAMVERLKSTEDEFVYIRGTLEKGFSRDKRDYLYSLKVDSPKQLWLEIPGGMEGGGEPAVETIELSAGEISWKDAPKHMGQPVVAVGKIIQTNNIGAITFLNFHENFRETVTLVIREKDYSKFSKPPEMLYQNRTIRARGKVSQYDGKPQIVIEDPSQIDLIE